MKKYDFAVPKELRQSSSIRIYGISIHGDNWVIEFVDKKDKIQQIKSYITGDKHNDIESVRDLVESRLSFFFDESAAAYCTGKLVDIIDRLYDTDAAAHAIDKVKKQQRAEAAKQDKESGLTKEKPTYTVKKYSGVTTVSPNGIGLFEAVIIAGHPMFVYTINGGTSVTFYEELETQDMKLRPPGKQEYPPDSALEFASEEEFMDYVRIANEDDNLYKLYKDVRKFYTKDYFVDTEPRNSTLLALYTITSYFQDKFSTVPYIWLIGDNGSGKNSILMTYSWLGYRVFYMSGASGANICEYLGTVEDGQGTIAEDELGDLDKDDYKKLLYMTGYAYGGSVPKILNASTDDREQRYYRSYCQKMSASESLPSIKYSKGVLDREFIIKCVKGFPKYNVKMTKKRTRTPEVLRLVNDLQSLRKRLFAYRLAHFDDVIEEIKGLSISGRALELTESALQLFHKYKETEEEDDKTLNEDILPTLSEFLKDRLGRRNTSLEAKLYPIVTKMVKEQGEILENDKIFATTKSEMEGTPVTGKEEYAFYVEELNRVVKRTDIYKVLREKFKAISDRIVSTLDGSRPNVHILSKETLERIRASYEDQYEVRINSIEEPSAMGDQPDQGLDDKEEIKEEANQCQTELKNIPDNHKNEEKDPSEQGENSPPVSTEPSQPSQSWQSYSIEEIIIRCMVDEQGNNKGYFTLQEWVQRLMFLPNEHWTEDQAEQTFQQLIEEGKLVETEPRTKKYKPNGEDLSAL